MLGMPVLICLTQVPGIHRVTQFVDAATEHSDATSVLSAAPWAISSLRKDLTVTQYSSDLTF